MDNNRIRKLSGLERVDEGKTIDGKKLAKDLEKAEAILKKIAADVRNDIKYKNPNDKSLVSEVLSGIVSYSADIKRDI